MSSYDQPQEYISASEFREGMALVRMQVSVPISVLTALGTTLVCTLVLHPSIGDISDKHITLLTPDMKIVGAYASVFFLFEIALCLLLTMARGSETKDTLVHGVGLRLSGINWLLAAWAVSWILRWFVVSATLVATAFLLALTIAFTLRDFSPALRHPFTAVCVHVPIALMLPLTIALTLQSGAVALRWVLDAKQHWVWPAVGVLAGVHALCALWEFWSLQYVVAAGNETMLLALLVQLLRMPQSSPIPEQPPRPRPLEIALITALAMHPLAIIAGLVARRHRNREGRIRLEEEAHAAEADA